DWSSDVCSSDLDLGILRLGEPRADRPGSVLVSFRGSAPQCFPHAVDSTPGRPPFLLIPVASPCRDDSAPSPKDHGKHRSRAVHAGGSHGRRETIREADTVVTGKSPAGWFTLRDRRGTAPHTTPRASALGWPPPAPVTSAGPLLLHHAHPTAPDTRPRHDVKEAATAWGGGRSDRTHGPARAMSPLRAGAATGRGRVH